MATQSATLETEWVPVIGFGDRLRIVRRKRHRSQDEMAALLGLKKVTYASWEAGRTPSLDEVQSVARRLYDLDHVPPWWTLGAPEPTARLWDASTRSSTDRASDYGSEIGRNWRSHRRPDRRRRCGVIPLHLVVDNTGSERATA